MQPPIIVNGSVIVTDTLVCHAVRNTSTCHMCHNPLCLQLGVASFRLFVKPQLSGARRATVAPRLLSLAGQGLGLQVFPGSVTEMTHVSRVPR